MARLVPPAAYAALLLLKQEPFGLLAGFLNADASLELKRDATIKGRRRVTRTRRCLVGTENIIFRMLRGRKMSQWNV